MQQQTVTSAKPGVDLFDNAQSSQPKDRTVGRTAKPKNNTQSPRVPSTRTTRGREQAIRVTSKAMRFLRIAGTAPAKRNAELARVVYQYKRRALQDLRALVGKRLERVHPLTGEGESLVVTPRVMHALCALVDALLANVRKRSVGMGDLQPLTPLTRALTSRLAIVSQRSFTRWMPWLEAAGVVLYQHGRNQHCGLVGFPELYRLGYPHTRAVVEAHLHASELHDEDRWWWAPMCRALLKTDVAGAELRAELRADSLATRVERRSYEVNKTAAINARICATKAAELELQRAKHLEERRKRDARRDQQQREDLERAAAAELQAFAALDDNRRRIAIEERKRKRALDAAELEARVRESELEHVLSKAANPPAIVNLPVPPRGQSGARNHDQTLSDQFTRSGSTAPASPARTGSAAAPAARKGSFAPDGAGDGLAWLSHMATSVLVDDGPAADRGRFKPFSRPRLVPVRDDGAGGAT